MSICNCAGMLSVDRMHLPSWWQLDEDYRMTIEKLKELIEAVERMQRERKRPILPNVELSSSSDAERDEECNT